jgi:glycosyltransferase involved in cell wall biosynthesis
VSTLPLISVVIPSYNHGHFLGEAIASVLAQDYPRIEVVVVNDGSSDDTAAVAARVPEIRYVEQPNRGLAAARNAGLAVCAGEMVVFLDADDRLLPGALEAGRRALAAQPGAGFAAGYSRFISRDGTVLPTGQPPRTAGEDPYIHLLRRNRIRNPAIVMFRRDVVAAAGGFCAGIDACADYDLYLRISRDWPVVFHDAVVADYRKHGGNMSDNSALMLRQLRRVMRRQRPHLVNPARREAFRQGMRNIHEYYGDRIVMQVRQRIRTGRGWRRTLEDVATLAWCHPSGFVEQLRRKLEVMSNRDGTREPPPAR